jgi:DNA-binding MarR family transcriptional regulator
MLHTKTGQPREVAEPVERVLKLDEFAPYYVRAIANRLAQAASRLYSRRFGIGLTEWSCLSTLAKEEEISATRICEMSGFDKGLVSRGLASLEAKGFVRTTPVKSHNRKRLIRFTPAGRSMYGEIEQLALEREDRLLKGFSRTDRAILMGYLRLMHRNVLELVASEADQEQPVPSAVSDG